MGSADRWMLGETAALDDYIPTPPSNMLGNAATAVKDWWTAQPSWLDRARTENQRTAEAFQRGGMGEIAKQLATDTNEAQDLYGAFGVGNVRGVRGQLPGNEGLSYLLGGPSQIGLIGKERGAINPNGISRLSVANAPEGYGSDRLVYTKDGQIVGAMQITKTPDAIPTIANTFVHPDYRRQGIATELNNQANSIYGNLSRSEGPSEAGEAFRKSLGKMGELAAVDEYHPPFYSAVERAVQGAKQNVAPGQQWAGFLRNQPGVKPEEVEALGLGKLFEQPGAVPKQAVLGEIAANRVNVGEVVKGGERPTTFSVSSAGNLSGAPALRADFATAAEAIAELDRRRAMGGYHSMAELPTPDSRTKFEQYTLPGGENYREMLLTLPTEDAPKAARMTALEGKLRNAGDYDTHEVNAMRREYKQLADETRASGTFKSPHFDEPNVLAHVRYNDRVIDGKKTLFVEEVQSDWHQAGKRKGYRGDQEAELAKLVAERDRLTAEANASTNPMEVGRTDRLNELHDRIRELGSSDPGVPDAPFKTTWPELAMKRIIREAAEKGYDKVAWTPGSVQAERYDLSKHVDGIRWEPTISTPDQRVVRIDPRDGKTINLQIDKSGTVVSSFPRSGGNQFEGRHLSDVVGKDIAEKIISGKEAGFLKDLDLKVGGEGMKGFYDEILPATVNKLVKKHGGRVQTGKLPAPIESFEPGSARAGLGDVGLPTTSVHSLDITPALRAQAMKGFPLFTAGGVAATGIMGEYARQDDYR